jgi:hypothetical protein
MVDPNRVLYESHPNLALLLNRGSALVEAAMDSSMTVESDVRPVQVRFVPGRIVVVQYSTKISKGGEAPRAETFVASTGQIVPGETSVVSTDGTDVAVWRASADPFLPGLRSVSNPDLAGRLLEQLGDESTEITLRRRAYRPGRRAVVEIRTPSERVFAKVVRPNRVADLQRAHASLASSSPIPASLGWAEASGIAILQALNGHTLTQAVTNGENPLPSYADLLELLDTMQHAETGETQRPSLVQRVAGHAEFIATIIPDLSTRARQLAQSIEDLATVEPNQTIHGDFHASQIMVNRSAVTGLVDIDTVGPGEQVDDMANFLAHLDALASAKPAFADRIAAFGAGFDATADPRQLRLRVAAALMGYARGPFRVQEQDWRTATEVRIRRAEHWLTTAESASPDS